MKNYARSCLIGLSCIFLVVPTIAWHQKPSPPPTLLGQGSSPNPNKGNKGDTGDTGNPGKDGESGKDADMTKVNANTRLSASNANRIGDTERRVGDLEETKWLFDTEVRLADGKHVAVSVYNSYDFRHRKNFAVGLKFFFKLGKSYEERRIEKLEKLLYEIQKSHGLILEVVATED